VRPEPFGIGESGEEPVRQARAGQFEAGDAVGLEKSRRVNRSAQPFEVE
jgi:hypothetical protein